MRKQLLSMTAAAAFLLTIGGAAAAKAVRADTIWEYEEGGLTSDPDCKLGSPVCATEYPIVNGQPDFTNPIRSIRGIKNVE